MKRLTSTDYSEPSQMAVELKNARMFLAFVAFSYPAWAWIHFQISPLAIDSYYERSVISALLLLQIGLSSLKRMSIPRKLPFLKLGEWILVAHYFSLVIRNHLAPHYAVATYFLVFFTVSRFDTKKIFFIFVLFVLSQSLLVQAPNPETIPYGFQLGLALCLAISYLGLRRRLNIEAALNESELTFRSMFETAGVGMAIVDLEGRIVKVNRIFLKVFISPGRRLMGLNFDELTGAVANTSMSMKLAIPFLSEGKKKQFQFETLMSKERGEGLWVKVSCSLIEPQNSMAFVLAIVEDLTEQKCTERLLTEERAKINHASKMTALGEMASGIAHEINNPIAVISASMSILNDLVATGVIEAEEVKKTSERVQRTVDRIAKIITGLRRFARDGSGDPFEPVQVAQIIQETLDLVSQNLQKHGIRLTCENTSGEQSIVCRSVEISQVLLNLISNAIDAISDLDERWIKIETLEIDGFVTILVSNSGPRLAQNLREKIFQPFFTTKPTGQGVGIGLSISIGIVKNHHGNLFVDSKSRNTCFVLQLPKSQPEAVARPA